jgi:imidazoleglycerol phosphate dehydratase HisB
VGLVWFCGEEKLKEVLDDFYGIRYFGNGVVAMEDSLGEVCVVTLGRRE